jgi:hypothetical protein
MGDDEEGEGEEDEDLLEPKPNILTSRQGIRGIGY